MPGETGKYGHPTPTQVNVKATAGKCILISGHDLEDTTTCWNRPRHGR
ncbi:hypothetical protein ACLB1T_23150 [Escherichia coli]